jgi:glycosyltransferase 2 family protein
VSSLAKNLIRPALTLGLVILVLALVDLSKLYDTLSHLSLKAVLIICAGYFCSQIMSSFKWWIIVRASGIKVGYIPALRAYFCGMFVNLAGLGLVGGDVARGLVLAGDKPVRAAALATVVADRFHGLGVLALIGATSALFFGANLPQNLLWVLPVVGLGIAAGWIIGPTVLRLMVPRKHWLRQKVEGVAAAFPRKKRVIALITAISFVFHCTQICLHAVIAWALGVSVPLTVLFVVVPFINIASSLPISWMGLGVREFSYKTFLAPTYLTPDQAVAFGPVWFMAMVFSSLVGGAVALLSGDLAAVRAKSAKMEEDVERFVDESEGPAPYEVRKVG